MGILMIRSVIRSFIPIFIFLVVWQLVAFMVSAFRGVPFPTPWATFMKLTALLGGQTLSDHTLYRHLADSIVRWLAGFVMAAIAGVVYGLFAGWWHPLESATYSIIHILQLIPGLAWIPVAILIFGIGETATVFMITMTAFPPVAINVLNGVKRLDTTFVDDGRRTDDHAVQGVAARSHAVHHQWSQDRTWERLAGSRCGGNDCGRWDRADHPGPLDSGLRLCFRLPLRDLCHRSADRASGF